MHRFEAVIEADFPVRLHRIQYFVYVSSGSSGETAHIRGFCKALTAHICDTPYTNAYVYLFCYSIWMQSTIINHLFYNKRLIAPWQLSHLAQFSICYKHITAIFHVSRSFPRNSLPSKALQTWQLPHVVRKLIWEQDNFDTICAFW